VLGKLIPAVRECAVGNKLEKLDRVNARLATELAPLLFEMNAIAPVLIGEVEKLLQQCPPAADDNTDPVADQKVSPQQEISQADVEVDNTDHVKTAKPRKKVDAGSTKSNKKPNVVSTNAVKKKTKVKAKPKTAAKSVAEEVPPKSKKAVSASKTTNAKRTASKRKKTATAAAERRALAVSIADADTVDDQHPLQLALPLMA